MKRAWLLSALVVQALACSAAPTSGLRSPISDRLAIRAIIGEGANQSDAALAGIASAIHNRGKQLFNVWVDCDPEGNGPGHLNIVREQ